MMKDIELLNKSMLIIIPVFGCLASMVNGYFIVYFTMMDDYVQSYNHFTASQFDLYFTIMVSALPVGAFIGSFIYNGFIEVYGENKAMRIVDVIAILAALLQVGTISFPFVCISRFFMGFYCAITTGLIPSWILSMSPSFTSGIFGTFNHFAIALGMAQAYCMGQFLQDSPLDKDIKLKLYIGMPIITSIVHLIGVCYFKFDNIERMIARRDHNEIIKFMKTVYGKKWKNYEKEIRNFKMLPVEIPVIKEENEDQQQDQEKESEQSKKSKNSILKSLKKGIENFSENCESRMIAIMLAVANQTCGVVAILQYSKQLFVKIEDSVADADTTILVLGFFQVFATLGSGFFINKFGRRPMMLIGQMVIVISLLGCTIVTFLVQKHEIITTILIFIYFFGYSISLGPLFMLYAIETLSNLGLVIQIYWGLMIVLTLSTDILIEEESISMMFGTFFLCSVFSFIYFYIKMIETKNVPRKQVRSLINKSDYVWENSQFLFTQSIRAVETPIQKSVGTI